MQGTSAYIAKTPDHHGFIQYTDDEHAIWRTLMARQRPLLEKFAHPAYLAALDQLALPAHHIPQCSEVSVSLFAATGWRVVPVPALIDFTEFFTLLANKRFPAASFIRRTREMDYLKEPDIFHEILGHTPLLLNSDYAEFVHNYGKTGLNASKEDRPWLARLFWFTIEFGLMQSGNHIKAIGAGLVSSSEELAWSILSAEVKRQAFHPVKVLTTDYKIDQLQKQYFVLESFEQLYELTSLDLVSLIQSLRHPPTSLH